MKSPEGSYRGMVARDILVAILRCFQFVVHWQYYDNQQLTMYIRAPSARDPSIQRYIRQPARLSRKPLLPTRHALVMHLFVGADEMHNKDISVKYLFQLMSMVCALSIVGLQTANLQPHKSENTKREMCFIWNNGKIF